MMKPEYRDIIYTIFDVEDGEAHEVRIGFDAAQRFQPTVIEFPELVVALNPQQLAELGHLLIALSRHDYDEQSVRSLIASYNQDCLVPAL